MTNLLDSIRPFDKQVPLVGALMAAAVLSACGGSDDPAGTLRLGGTVAGLAAGKSVELQNNGAEALRVSESGRFSFSTPLESGAAYAVLMTLLCGLLIALYMLMLFRQRRRSLANEA